MNLKTLFHACSKHLRCSIVSYVLAVCWVLGLFLGVAYAYRADRSYFLLMRMAASGCVSIVGLFFVLFFPLLLSAFAVYFHHHQWLFPICFMKSFLFASCSCAISVAFGSAAWLVRFLLQFSDFCAVPFLYWFCLRNVKGYNDHSGTDFLICFVAIGLFGVIDFCMISPYLVGLIDI